MLSGVVSAAWLALLLALAKGRQRMPLPLGAEATLAGVLDLATLEAR